MKRSFIIKMRYDESGKEGPTKWEDALSHTRRSSFIIKMHYDEGGKKNVPINFKISHLP